MLDHLDTFLEIQGFYRIHYLELSSGYQKPSIPYFGFSLTYIDKGTAFIHLQNTLTEMEKLLTFTLSCSNVIPNCLIK